MAAHPLEGVATAASTCSVASIQLRNFRSYGDLVLRDLPEKFVVLTGDNGAGKTNLLDGMEE